MTDSTRAYELELLGSPRLRGPAGPLSGLVSRRHPLGLLALLAAHPGGQVTRDRLIGYLWPETSDSRARRRLRVVLHSLRSELGADAIVSVGDALRLSPGRVHADVRVFRQRLEEGRLEAAVRLYSGPFLDGFHLNGTGAFDRWAETQRDQLGRAYEEALRALAREAGAQSDWRGAAQWWRRLCAERPLDAEATRQCAEALAAAGDPARAVRLLRRFTERLRAELGVDPPLDVTALLVRLVNGDESDEAGDEDASRTAPGDRQAGSSADGERPASGHGGGDRRGRPRAADRTPVPRRRRSLRLGAAAIGVVLLISAAALLDFRNARTEAAGLLDRRVAVAPFADHTGDPTLAVLGPMAGDWIAQELVATGLVDVIPLLPSVESPRRRPANEAGNEGELRQRARRAGARLFVTGDIYPGRDVPRLRARVIDLGSGALLRTVQADASDAGDLAGVLNELRQRIAGALATVVDERLSTWAHLASQPPSYRAYDVFSRGLDQFFEGGRDNYLAAATSFERAASLDSGFTAAVIWAARARRWGSDHAGADSLLRTTAHRRDEMPRWDRALFDYETADIRGDREGAHRALERLIEDVRSPGWIVQAAAAAYFANHPRRTIELLETLDPDEESNAGNRVFDWTRRYWIYRTRAHHRLGEHERELAVAREWAARDGASGRTAELWALAALGEADELLRLLRDEGEPGAVVSGRSRLYWRLARELAAHGYPDQSRVLLELTLEVTRDLPPSDRTGRADRARALLLLGKLERSRRIYQALAAEVDGWGLLGPLGVIAARQGDGEKAEGYAKDIADFRTPWDYGEGTLWRAAIAGAGGHRDRALELLRQALDEGLAHHSQIHTRVGLVSLQDDPRYSELFRPQ